jgi:N utilization substance protein B
MTPTTRRTRAREVALQVLYQQEQNPQVAPAELRLFSNRRLRDERLRAFSDELVDGIRTRRSDLDALISVVAENWSLERMAAIDRNILRLGAYEMLHCPDVPIKVAINEAVELAKRYSTAQSSRFVNGILDRLQDAANTARGEGQTPSLAPSSPDGESAAETNPAQP